MRLGRLGRKTVVSSKRAKLLNPGCYLYPAEPCSRTPGLCSSTPLRRGGRSRLLLSPEQQVPCRLPELLGSPVVP